MTLSDPGFKVTVYYKYYISKTVRFSDKVTKNANRKPYTIYRMVTNDLE